MAERIIAVLSGLLTIILSLLTIYTFRWDRGEGKKNKLALLVTTIVLAVVTVFIFALPEKEVRNPEPSPSMQNHDSITETKSPVTRKSKQIEKDEEIAKLVREARRLKSISTTEALSVFKKAYDLLPRTQKNEKFIDSVEGYSDFNTQINLLNDYFITLNY